MQKMTKSQLLTAVAEKSGLTKKEATAALDALSEVLVEQLKSVGAATLPGLLNLKLVNKPATPARKGINPFTKEPTTFKAKPASKKVKAMPLKALKDAVA